MAVQVKASNECGRRVESMAVADLRDEAELLRQQIALEERVHQVRPVSEGNARLWLNAGVVKAQGTWPQSGLERLSVWCGMNILLLSLFGCWTGIPAPACCHKARCDAAQEHGSYSRAGCTRPGLSAFGT